MNASLPTAVELASLLRCGELAPVDVVESCLERIDRLEGTIRAWVHVDRRGALDEAQRLGRLAADGRWLGPLHGIPVAVKDIFDMAGLPTGAGSPLRAGHIARQDATVVRRLREAGAVLIGKSVTTEWACFDPPPTRNPLDTTRTPGGSSSGSAAAVACGMCVAALGSQTGGSIVRPASYCGVAGLKPTFGRVSRAGVVPISAALDHVGPIGRSVADLAVLLGAIAGPDPDDPAAAREPIADYAAAIVHPPTPRLGWIDAPLVREAGEEVQETVRRALEQFRAAGAAIEQVRLPASFDQVLAMHWRIMAAEAAVVHRAAFSRQPEAFSPKVRHLIESGLAIAPGEYEEALEHQRSFRRELDACFGRLDALLMPATDTTAPRDLSTTGSPRFQSPWSYAGAPVVSLPCGLAADGMPVALQFVGRWFNEACVLAAAAWCERVLEAPTASG